MALSPFELGAWRVEPAHNRLIGADGAAVPLEPKVMRVLACLAQRNGDVVTRAELIAEVWGGLNVVDGALGRAVYQLRRVLDAAGETHIETIRQVGYRLRVPVTRAIVPSRTAPPLGIGAEPFRMRDLVLVLCCAVLVGGVGSELFREATPASQPAPMLVTVDSSGRAATAERAPPAPPALRAPRAPGAPAPPHAPRAPRAPGPLPAPELG